jgi:hypothetical protein
MRLVVADAADAADAAATGWWWLVVAGGGWCGCHRLVKNSPSMERMCYRLVVVGTAADHHHHHHHHGQAMDFSDSVLDAADADGRLSAIDADNLLWMHGETLGAYIVDTQDKGESFAADALLAWLGY